MSSIFILSNSGSLTRESEHLVYVSYDMKRTRILPFRTEHIIIVGNVTVSGDAMRLIMKNEIPVVYLSQNGTFYGRIVYQDSKNIFLRQKQFQLLSDKKKSLEIAKSIVIGKIKNQLTFIQRIKRSRGTKVEFESAVKGVKSALKNAEKVSSVDSLRGVEGNAAKLYFSAFACNLIPEWAAFEKRTRNPPQSNVNAVLSFLYSLLTHYITTAIEAQGLDTMAGCLHELNYGRDVLAFDLVEEFRVPIADTLTCYLFNKNILSEKDFRTQDFSSESRNVPASAIENVPEEEAESAGDKITAVYLNDDGMKKVFEAFIEKINSAVIYAPAKKRMSFLEIMMEQSNMYKRVVLGEETEYKPFYYR